MMAFSDDNGFRWDSCQAYLFDIDGTLMNCRDGVHYNAFHHALRETFGVNSAIDGVPLHGNTDAGILRAVLRREGVLDSDIEARLPLMIQRMSLEVERHAGDIQPELCPSIADLIRGLDEAGKLLGVVSGSFEKIGWTKLRSAGLAPFFVFGVFSDSNEKREDIFRQAIREVHARLGDGATTCVVGDTPADVIAARAAGIHVISVATGIYSCDQLAACVPDLCIPCCTDLLAH